MSDREDFKEFLLDNPIEITSIKQVISNNKELSIKELRDTFKEDILYDLDKDVNKMSRYEISKYIVNSQQSERDMLYAMSGII